ncbi:uncharacterized protein LOC142234346 [Haematobia irritans]|uniref:uncharacterized protein LOC142234346 n=1 Tax=Haematobia irritans TaxID=7368 RepID=UPI003F50A95D
MNQENSCNNGKKKSFRECYDEIAGALLCHDNDYQRLHIKLKSLQYQLQEELNQAIFPHSEMQRKYGCSSNERAKYFERNTQDIDKVKETFENRINIVKKECEKILDSAKSCIQHMQKLKLDHKQSIQYQMDHLRKMAWLANSRESRRNIEKAMNDLNKQYDADLYFIEKCEMPISSFLNMLRDNTSHPHPNECTKFAEWERQKTGNKSMNVVSQIEENIKTSMGATLINLLAGIHTQKPSDVQSFAAAYLLNLQRNENDVLRKIEEMKLLK